MLNEINIADNCLSNGNVFEKQKCPSKCGQLEEWKITELAKHSLI